MKDIYVYEGTRVLINKLGIKDPIELDKADLSRSENKYKTIRDYEVDKYEYRPHYNKD